MANIFIDGDKIANQKDIEAISSKTNTDTNLYELYVNDNPLKLADIVNHTGNNIGRLKVIHQRVNNTGTETYGNYDSLLSFGGDDAIFAIDVSMSGAKAKILSPKWSEEIAWKSDIATKIIQQDVDINTLTTEGNFFVMSNNMDHFPTEYRNQWYFLNVVNPEGDANRIKQTVTPDHSEMGWTMTRTGAVGNGTVDWNSWLISDFANGKILKTK